MQTKTADRLEQLRNSQEDVPSVKKRAASNLWVHMDPLEIDGLQTCHPSAQQNATSFHVRVQARVLALWKTIANTPHLAMLPLRRTSKFNKKQSSIITIRACCVQFVGPTRAKPESRGKHQKGRNLTRLTRNRFSVRHAIVKLLSEQTLLATVKLNATDHCIWSR